jgi:hypothetical protein
METFQLKQTEKLAHSLYSYETAMAASTGIIHTAQLIIVIRDLDSVFDIPEQIASLCNLKYTTNCAHLFLKIKKTLASLVFAGKK